MSPPACPPTDHPDQIDELVGRHHHSLMRLARRYVSSQAVAEEVVQETWLAVLKGIAGFEGRSSMKTWIFRILANRARTRGAREARSLPFSCVGSTREDGDSNPELECFGPRAAWMFQGRTPRGAGPEKAVLDREARGMVIEELERLPPKQGAVVYLRDVRGWSSSEVCDAMRITDIYQRVLLHRGRSKVRTELAEAHGVGSSNS